MKVHVNLESTSDTLIVIPTYNNDKAIHHVITAAKRAHPEVLVVDDGSLDQTPREIKRASPPYLITNSHNLGKGRAIVRGMDWARRKGYNKMIVMDGDGQHDPDDIKVFLKAAAQNPNTLIIGRRDFAPKSSGHVTFGARFGRVFSNLWVFLETGTWLSDTQSGFRLYPLSQSARVETKSRHYDFEIEVLVKSLWRGVKVMEIPIKVYYPPKKERVSHFLPFKDNLRLSLLHGKLFTINSVARLTMGLWDRKNSLKNRPLKERKGSIFMPFFLKTLGHRGCYLLLPLPLLFYFLTSRMNRHSILEFYHRLSAATALVNIIRAFRNYLYFGASLIDRLIVLKGTYQRQKKLTFLTTREHSRFHAGAILVGAHFGDWFCPGIELARISSVKMAIVIDSQITPQFHDLIKKFGQDDITFIDAATDGIGIVLKVKDVLSGGGCVCFLGDRFYRRQNSILVSFLGKETKFPISAYEIAALLKSPVFTFFCLKSAFEANAPYIIHHKKIYDGSAEGDPKRIGTRFVRELEGLVRRNPEHWFNFYPFWQHGNEE